jgi:hypothetical protein
VFFRHAHQCVAWVPAKARILLGLFLIAALLMAIHTAITAKTASLHLKLQHDFRNAQISLWVDDDLAYLAQSSSLPVQIPVHGQPVLPGHVYVAPDGFHMAVGPQGQIHLSKDEPENGLRPSVSHLFRSVTHAYGSRAVGVLLTGMGKDGAWELKLMKEQGAVTIAQDRDTSVVHGMPGEAIRVGGATYVLSPERIRMALTSLVSVRESEITNAGNNALETSNFYLGRNLSEN